MFRKTVCGKKTGLIHLNGESAWQLGSAKNDSIVQSKLFLQHNIIQGQMCGQLHAWNCTLLVDYF